MLGFFFNLIEKELFKKEIDKSFILPQTLTLLFGGFWEFAVIDIQTVKCGGK